MPDRRYDTLVSTDALAQLAGKPELTVFDCRFVLSDPAAGHGRYQEAHIPGAHYVDLNEDLSSAATPESGRHPLPLLDELEEKLRLWGVGKHSQVVVYDDAAGAIAGRMWWLLRYAGHQSVALLDGGFGKWQEEGRPLTSSSSMMPRPGDFSASPHPSMQITTAELERSFRDGNTTVIDARSPERYSGEKETVDSEGGHIPGAVNHYLRNNLDEHGCFLPQEKLRSMYTRLQKPNTVHSCGSGVTACHNLLAMEIAGLNSGRLYVGSWSEWIRSKERPRATGKAP